MTYKQKICIDFDWALLTVLADIDHEICGEINNVKLSSLGFFSTKNDLILNYDHNMKINFYNIAKSDELNNYVPIQFIESNQDVNLYFLEETEYIIIFEIKSNKTILKLDKLFCELILHKPESFSFNEVKDNIFIVNLNFRSHVGKTFIDIFFEDKKFCLPIEVRSRKIDYEADYPQMISDLARYSSSLFFDHTSSLFHNYNKYNKKSQTKYEIYMLLEYIFNEKNLPTTFEYLSKNLYSNVIISTQNVPISLAKNINSLDLMEITSNPDNIVEMFNDNFLFEVDDRKFSLQFVNESKYEDNIDVPENRFFKYFLEYLKYLIDDLKNDPKIIGFIRDRLNVFESSVNNFLSLHYFDEISKLTYIPFNSQVLQKKEGYKDILKYFLMLDTNFKINFDLITNEIKGFEKRLSKIYEFWCYFMLYEVIQDLTGSIQNYNLFIRKDWSLSLQTGFYDKFEYIFNDKKIYISIAFNQKFNGQNSKESNFRSYSRDMRPDFSVLIQYENNLHFIHFDAKYKVNNGKVKEEDIHKMHTYKDSIEYTIGSFVLFPGNDEEIFNGFDLGAVGAFPLNPLKSEKEKEHIKSYLCGIINEIINYNP